MNPADQEHARRIVTEALASAFDDPLANEKQAIVMRVAAAIREAREQAAEESARIADEWPHRKGYSIADRIREKFGLSKPAYRPYDQWRGISKPTETQGPRTP